MKNLLLKIQKIAKDRLNFIKQTKNKGKIPLIYSFSIENLSFSLSSFVRYFSNNYFLTVNRSVKSSILILHVFISSSVCYFFNLIMYENIYSVNRFERSIHSFVVDYLLKLDHIYLYFFL